MASVIAFVLVVVFAYLVVLVAATAYELTGLDRETARFQAFSAFTGAGFTTRASEAVVRHPQRRRITLSLIVLGYACSATVVAALVTSVDSDSFLASVENFALLAVSMVSLYLVYRRTGVHQWATDRVRRYLTVRLAHEDVPHEELLMYKQGFAITRIEVPAGSRVNGLKVREMDLRSYRLQILAVESGSDVHAIPDPDYILHEGDHIILYGDVAKVQTAFAALEQTRTRRHKVL